MAGDARGRLDVGFEELQLIVGCSFPARHFDLLTHSDLSLIIKVIQYWSWMAVRPSGERPEKGALFLR
jgi:hypothetical protein